MSLPNIFRRDSTESTKTTSRFSGAADRLASFLKPDATFASVGAFAIQMLAAATFFTLLGSSVSVLFFLPAGFLWFSIMPAAMVYGLVVAFLKFNGLEE